MKFCSSLLSPFNNRADRTDECSVTVHRAAPDPGVRPSSRIAPGTVLVSGTGQVRIVRSRTAAGDGWNCADGAAITDAMANDPDRWTPYTPEQLAAALTLAEDVRLLSGQRELAGGIATWDACSGRPCVLPKLARVVNRPERDPVSHWLSAID